MKLKTTKEAIQKCLPIINLCASEGIFSLLYVKSEDKLTLGAGSPESAQMFVDIEAEILEPGSCLTDAKLLKTLWPSIPDGEIILETSGGSLLMKQGKNKWTLSIGNAEDYPIISQKVEGTSTISLSDLATAVNMVSFAISSEVGNPALDSVNLSNGTFTATDSLKLAQVTTPIMGLNITFSSTLQKVAQIFTRVTNSDDLSISQGETWVKIESNNVSAWLSTLALEFPSTAVDMIRNMRDEEPIATVLLDVKEVNPLIQAAVALHTKSRRCAGLLMKIGKELSISLEGDAGAIEHSFPLECQGYGKVWIDPQEFGEVLRASPTNELTLNFYSENRPILGLAKDIPWGCALAVLSPKEEYEPDF